MAKEMVPVITDEDVAKCDASATARAAEDIARLVPEEPEPKPHKHSYRKDGTCACGHVRNTR